jgi:hypothetical protein
MPQQVPAEQASILLTTVPDVDSLFVMHAATAEAVPRMLHNPQLCWRINRLDWQYLTRVVYAGTYVAVMDTAGGYTLFGSPVDLVNPDPGAFPQLVIVNDRRN